MLILKICCPLTRKLWTESELFRDTTSALLLYLTVSVEQALGKVLHCHSLCPIAPKKKKSLAPSSLLPPLNVTLSAMSILSPSGKYCSFQMEGPIRS